MRYAYRGKCFAPTDEVGVIPGGENAMRARYDPERQHRRSIRLPGYDYRQPGAYFVTICTRERECLFGDVVGGKMGLNDAGTIVLNCWKAIPRHFGGVCLDAFVVMPNHVHGIIVLLDVRRTSDAARSHVAAPRPVENGGIDLSMPDGTVPGSLGAIIQNFKAVSTRKVSASRGVPGVPIWQRNYYERILRDEDEMQRIQDYIEINPVFWEEDEHNPLNTYKP
jgi:putative transposase